MKAPFDGIVTARLVSVGELVGANGPTQLATIVQIDPIYVNFTISEQDVLRVRAEIRAPRADPGGAQEGAGRGRAADRRGLSAQGHARLRRADRRAVDRHARGARHPAESEPGPAAGLFRARAGAEDPQEALLVPDVALGSDQGGRYVLVVNKDNVVEQRKVEIGPGSASCG